MMIGLTILAVLTFIAIGEIRKTAGEPLKGEDWRVILAAADRSGRLQAGRLVFCLDANRHPLRSKTL
jgi:hypothetical protein